MDKLAIVMLSGGVDSVGALYKLLKYTDADILAHHINFINSEKRFNAERLACMNSVKYLKQNVREFEYTESTFTFDYNKHIGWDIITSMYIGAMVAKNYMDMYVEVELCIGDTKDDFGAYKWKSPIAQSIALIASLESPQHEKQLIPTIIQPVIKLTKNDIIDMIPEELFMMTWSCRVPVTVQTSEGTTIHECGNCITCNDLKKINKFKDKEYLITK